MLVGTEKKAILLRCASIHDLDFVHACVESAIGETLTDDHVYQAREKARFPKVYLFALMQANPNYVLVAVGPDGENVGAIVSSPDHGAVVVLWVYLLPAYRKGLFALRIFLAYVPLWQKSVFHKIIAYARADNKVPQLLLQRAGFEGPVLMRKHYFGVDFCYFEKFLEKASPGYEMVPTIGKLAVLRFTLRKQFARFF